MLRSESKLRLLLATTKNPHVRPVVLAYFAFNLAELGAWVSVLVWAYQVHGIAGASLIAILQLVPSALLAPVGAALMGRWTPIHGLVLGYLLQAVALITTGGLIVAGAPKALIVAAAMTAAVSMTLTRPVHFALLPLLSARTEDLTAANAVSSVAEGAAAFLGPLVSGVVTGWHGPGQALVGFGILTALASARTWRLQVVPGAGDRPARTAVESRATVLAILAEPGVLVLIGVGGLGFVIMGMLDIVLVALAIDHLHLSAAGPGLLTSALGIGMVLGGGATLLLVGRRRLSGPLIIALVSVGLPLALLGLVARPWISFVLVIAVGSARSFFDVTARTLTQRVLPDRLLTTMFGLAESVLMAGLCLGALLAQALTAAFGVRGALFAAGAGFPLLALLFLPRLNRLDRGAQLSLEDFRVLESVPMLALLPPRILERLARDSSRLVAKEGVRVVIQGEQGDAFYVVESGGVDVSVDGRHVRSLGPGGWFGEIALLREVPRTATVTANSHTSLLVLERNHFLFAVTGAAPVGMAMQQHIDDTYLDG